jgi:uncharacterized membrane protein HdeD (DUF308 family)
MMLADRWWTLVLRGVAAVIFGVLTFIAPGASLLALVVLFGVYAIVNGVLSLALSGRRPAGEAPWGWLVFESIVSILAGVVTLFWPKITALALLLVIAFWAIVTGIAELSAAVRLRKHIRNEWLLALSGVLSIAFGVLMLVYPGAGALAVVIWIGAYAVLFGALLIALGVRLRTWGRSSMREVPPGAIPVTR